MKTGSIAYKDCDQLVHMPKNASKKIIRPDRLTVARLNRNLRRASIESFLCKYIAEKYCYYYDELGMNIKIKSYE